LRFAWRILLALVLLPALAWPAVAAEAITDFASQTTLAVDGSVEVTETIAVRAEGNLIRHGIFRNLFKTVDASWKMYPIGFLFGLGFDTATEVGLLAATSGFATQQVPFYVVLLLPLLFAAGMSLADTTDGVMMLGAYGWAFVNPVRKLYYNMTITFVSVIVAVLIGGIEALGLIADKFGLTGGVWDAVGNLSQHFGLLGYLIVGVFVLSWIGSILIYRLKGYDRLELRVATLAMSRPIV